jgi:hypothetical protein
MGRRRTADTPAVVQTVMEMPTIRPLSYGSLDWVTHPIDLYDGPQGWGPFYGPWTPWDFRDPAADIAFSYGMGESNEWQFAPPYDVITVFGDPALEWVNNTSYDSAMAQAQEERQTSYNSTIANVVPNDGNSSFLNRLQDMLKPPKKEG